MQKSKSILIISDAYPPEISSSANLMQELAQALQKRGHRITITTSYPQYYLAPNLDYSRFPAVCDEEGIRVIRVKTPPYRKINFIIRGLSQLFLPLLYFKATQKNLNEKPNIVIVYSPPLLLALVGRMIKHQYGARFLLNIQDIFPQNAIDLGILRNPIPIRFFEWIEKQAYKSADMITFHSKGGRQFMIEKKAISPEKIMTLQNWINLDNFQSKNKNVSFRKLFKLEGKFIFLFGGIMGPSQGLAYLLSVAEKVKDISEIIFLIVGDGMEKTNLEIMIKEKKLRNVIIKSFVSKELYSQLVSECDIGVVCLSSKNKTPFVPGKFLGYLAAGKPVIAFLNKESDGFGIIEDAGCGYATVSDNVDKGAQLVRKLYVERNALVKFGENGRHYAENNLSLDICIQKLEKLLS